MQGDIVGLFRKTYEGRICFVNNGAWTGRLAAIRAKAEGLESGHPDLIIYSPAGVFLIEVKAPGGVISERQKEFLSDVAGWGIQFAVCFSLDHAKAAFTAWNLPFKSKATRSELDRVTGL